MDKYAKLGELGDIFIGLTYKPEDVSSTGTIVLRSSNIQDGELAFDDIVRVQCEVRENLFVKPNDILMCSRNGSAKLVGKCTLLPSSPEAMTFGTFMTVIRTPYNRYLRYFFDSPAFRNQLKGSATTTINQITRKMLDDIQVPIYDVKTQDCISAQFEKISKLIALRKEQLAKLDQLIKSRFVELFGDPMHSESKWIASTYGDEFEISSGGTPATGEKIYWENGTIPWIGSNMCQDTILYENDGKFITEEGYAHSSAKWFYTGTVLVALVGATIGKTALLRFDTTTNQNIVGIDVNSNGNFTSEYVFYHLQMQYDKFMAIGSGKFKMANQGFIRQLPLLCPPKELQTQFADFVEQTNKSKLTIHASLDKLELLKKSLMQQYFG